MTKARLQYLLEKYLDERATPEERAEYDAWYEQTVLKGEDLFSEEASPAAESFKQQLFSEISLQIAPAASGEVKWRKMWAIGKWAAAASIILVCFRLLFSHPFGSTSEKETPAVAIVSDNIVRLGNTSSAMREIHLKDGSVVKLYPKSELSYWPAFGVTDRKVYLSGKAFFEAAKDRDHPFTVYSHAFSTVALGTSFTVTAWPDADHVEVALHTGKVMVGHLKDTAAANGRKVYLLPGQQVDWNIGSDVASVRTTTAPVPYDRLPPSYGGRTGYAITFDQTPLPDVLDSIGQGYSVKLNFNKETLSGMIFSGRIREKDSLSQVLQRIASLNDLEIRSDSRGFSIRKVH